MSYFYRKKNPILGMFLARTSLQIYSKALPAFLKRLHTKVLVAELERPDVSHIHRHRSKNSQTLFVGFQSM
jgi:hypothetical protein